MLLFCPGCGNGLIVEEGQRCHRFACNTCPYVHNITRKVRSTGGSSPCGPRGPGQASARPDLPAALSEIVRILVHPPTLDLAIFQSGPHLRFQILGFFSCSFAPSPCLDS